jgi:hypothetical protein
MLLKYPNNAKEIYKALRSTENLGMETKMATDLINRDELLAKWSTKEKNMTYKD